MAALSGLKVDEADAVKFDALLGAQRGAADAAGCVKGLCSLALRGRYRLRGHCVARVQKVQKVLPAFGRRVQRVVVSPAAMSIKTALRSCLPLLARGRGTA